MAKMGRPRIEIDEQQFEGLCSLQCTLQEMAGFFHCSEDTVENWCKRTYNITFSEAFKKYSAKGKMSLRRIQFKLAEKSAAMAIFLGKNYLGQRDRYEYADDTATTKLDSILAEMREKVEAESEAERVCPERNEALEP